MRNVYESPSWSKLTRIIELATAVGGAVVARANKHLTLFLVPDRREVLETLWVAPPVHLVRITYDDAAWYVIEQDGSRLFSFGLPMAVFRLYDDAGLLTPERALDLKQGQLSEITALLVREGVARPIALRLDLRWLTDVRRILRSQRGVADACASEPAG